MIIKDIFYSITGYLRGDAKPGPLWWFFHGSLAIISGFFAFFGFLVLQGAYTLKDPFSFIMTFFSSNFIILISLTMLGVFTWRMFAAFRNPPTQPPNKE